MLVQWHTVYCTAPACHYLSTGCLGTAVYTTHHACRCIQAEHFGKLALPAAEFLALSHDTPYAGYAASGSGTLDQIQEEPFIGIPSSSPIASSPPLSSPRKASEARLSPSSPSKSPRKAHTTSPGAAQLDRINTGIHDVVMQPITCNAATSLEQVSYSISQGVKTEAANMLITA